eukprot:TRINITY_DN5866_c0_g1_i1.p1 TRINITY_DN5866_c0_g1~~TRINITY_DN5866_c0_g1_i1.p1  ORF type:complete len:364 (-),score=75.65 TRINITY_DN5866_c0_g1_i1:95-1162(-)
MNSFTSATSSRKRLFAFAGVSLTLLVFFLLAFPIPLAPTYTSQESYQKYSSSSTSYNIAIIADMDKDSKIGPYKWKSLLRNGRLERNSSGTYRVEWGDDHELTSTYNEKGRGMELSELVMFRGQLLACDDRTGIVFQVSPPEVFPKFITAQGDGDNAKGMKCEWMTVKDGKLWMGSIGKEWTTVDGTPLHNDLYWVKEVDEHGSLIPHNWLREYEAVRAAAGAQSPGYLVHEAINWDSVNSRWVFLPRRVSTEKYSVDQEALQGSNTIIITDPQFSSSEVKQIGSLLPSRGFSSFKFVPFRHNEVIALKTFETDDFAMSYITVLDIESGQVLLDDTLIPADHSGTHYKFEGVEFV